MLLILLWSGLGINLLSPFARGRGSLTELVVALFFLAIAVGLFRLVMWARNLSVVLLWFVVLVPLAIFGPFGDMDRHAAGGELTLTYKWVATAIIVGVVLLPLHVLGKHKGEFRKKLW